MEGGKTILPGYFVSMYRSEIYFYFLSQSITDLHTSSTFGHQTYCEFTSDQSSKVANKIFLNNNFLCAIKNPKEKFMCTERLRSFGSVL